MDNDKLNALYEAAKKSMNEALSKNDSLSFWRYNLIGNRILRWKLAKLK